MKFLKAVASIRFEKPALKFFSRIGTAAVLTLLVSVPAAVATTYNFTFTGGDGVDATGTIDIEGGVAQSGSINVTGVPIEAPPFTLLTAAGSLVPDPASPSTLTLRNHDGDDIIFDNIDNVLNDPSLNGNGLGFASGPYQDSAHYNTLINLWGNSPGSYSLFVAEANLDDSGDVIGDAQYVYHISNGSLNVTTVTVPEPSTGVLIILSALTVGFVAIRRRPAA